MASSIHIKKAVNGIINHNSREGFSNSVVFTDEKNELLNDSKDAYKIYRSELAKRAKAYTNRTNQKLQKKAITHLSAIVNLEQHHHLDDLEEIKNHLESKLDNKVFQMSIHRDEGKLISKDDTSIIFTTVLSTRVQRINLSSQNTAPGGHGSGCEFTYVNFRYFSR